jgi:hypothetical protein
MSQMRLCRLRFCSFGIACGSSNRSACPDTWAEPIVYGTSTNTKAFAILSESSADITILHNGLCWYCPDFDGHWTLRVIAYSVTQRTQELGIRLALDAQPRDILKLVVGQGLPLATAGILLGLDASAQEPPGLVDTENEHSLTNSERSLFSTNNR